MAGEAPVIETERLRLRGFRSDDLMPQLATWSDPEVVRFGGGAVLGREDVWRRMLCVGGCWSMLGYGYWAVERRDDGAWLGQVGFADLKRDMKPSIEGLPEAGWVFASFAQGQGYASEALAAALQWADRNLPGREIAAIIDPANLPSIRLATSHGFGSPEETIYKEEPILLFRRPAA
jgi:RimJ/RimL family protein N-acetyltransferase